MTFIYLLEQSGAITGPVEFPPVPGIGLQLPANAMVLEQALPAPDAGKTWAIFNGEAVQLEDHRGPVYSTETGAETYQIELGPLSPGLTAVPRPGAGYQWLGNGWVRSATALFESQLLAINQACERLVTAGFVSSALGEPHQYDSQLYDQLNLTGAILRGADMLFPCRDGAGGRQFCLHSAAQLHQVGDDFTLYKMELLQKANQLKLLLDQALAADDVAGIAGIVWEDARP